MHAFRALRQAVIGFCILLAVLVALTVFEDESLPTVLRDWSKLQSTPLFPVVVGILGLIGVVIGSLAILAHKKWGAWLHLISTAVGLLAGALMGALVASAATATVDSLLMIASGNIYGLAFFTDALASNAGEPNKSPQRNAGAGPAISHEAPPSHRTLSFEKTACAQPPRG